MKKIKWNRTLTYGGFVFLYILVGYYVFHFFFAQGYTLIQKADGFRQHVKAMAYIAKWLKGVFYHIFVEHSLSVQNFAFGIGYGEDIPTTLAYYGIGDILYWPALFINIEKIDKYYQALIMLRPCLAGVFFLMYVRALGFRKILPNLAGAMAYSFGGLVLFLGMVHPMFVTPLMYLPLIFLGVEKILREKRPAIFIVSLFFAIMANFYFFFSLAIFTAVYGIWRVICIEAKDKKIKEWIKPVIIKLLMFLGYAMVAIMMAGMLLLPIILLILDAPRAGEKVLCQPLYELRFYKKLFENFIAYVDSPSMDTEMSFAAVALPTVLYVVSRKHKSMKAAFAGIIMMITFPVFGFALSGFTYMNNRWTYFMALFIAVAIVIVGHDTEEKVPVMRASCSVLFMLLGVGAFLWGLSKRELSHPENVRVSVYIIIITTVLLAVTAFVKNRIWANAVQVALLAMTVISICANSFYGLSEEYGSSVPKFIEKPEGDEFNTFLRNTEAGAVNEIYDNQTFYRYSGRNLLWNAPLQEGISSTQFYFSLNKAEVPNYFKVIGNPDQQSFAYFALDDRMIPLALAGVRAYSLAYDNFYEYQFVPYGFRDLGMVENYHLYDSENAFPFGFTYTNYYTADTFAQMTSLEKQEAMLFGCLLEDKNAKDAELNGIAAINATEAKENLCQQSVPYEMVLTEGVTFENDTFTVTEPEAMAIFSFDGLADCETYLQLADLWVSDCADIVSMETCSYRDGAPLVGKELRYLTERYAYYSGWHDYAMNFGYTDEPINAISICFKNPGVYSTKGVSVVCQPADTLLAQRTELTKDQLLGTTDGPMVTQSVNLNKNPVSSATNRITGYLDATKDEILCLNIPYNKGWKIYVDGKKTPYYKVNEMFMGLNVGKGHHTIEMRYHTYGMTLGLISSIIGCVLFVGIILYRRKTVNITRICREWKG